MIMKLEIGVLSTENEIFVSNYCRNEPTSMTNIKQTTAVRMKLSNAYLRICLLLLYWQVYIYIKSTHFGIKCT